MVTLVHKAEKTTGVEGRLFPMGHWPRKVKVLCPSRMYSMRYSIYFRARIHTLEVSSTPHGLCPSQHQTL